MPQFEAQFNSISATLQGLIVSSILITASISSIFAGHLSDRISRTRTFALGGLVFGVGSLIASTSYKLPQLFVGRCIAGVGEGLFLSTVTVYILEISPTNLRGRLSCLCQLLITTGIAAGKNLTLSLLCICLMNHPGYFVSYGSINLSSSISWRLLFIMQAIVSFIFSAGSLFLPHSPRWLQHVGRTEDAARAWGETRFHGHRSGEGARGGRAGKGRAHFRTRVCSHWSECQGQTQGCHRHRVVRQRCEEADIAGCLLDGHATGIFFLQDNLFTWLTTSQACGIDGVLYVRLSIILIPRRQFM